MTSPPRTGEGDHKLELLAHDVGVEAEEVDANVQPALLGVQIASLGCTKGKDGLGGMAGVGRGY